MTYFRNYISKSNYLLYPYPIDCSGFSKRSLLSLDNLVFGRRIYILDSYFACFGKENCRIGGRTRLTAKRSSSSTTWFREEEDAVGGHRDEFGGADRGGEVRR